MKSRPDILIFIDWYLPAYKAGGPIRSCANMVAHLHEDFHFHLVCSDRDYLDPTTMADIEVDRWTAGPHGESVMFLSPTARTAGNYRKLMDEVAPQHVFINGVFSKEFSILPLRATKGRTTPVTISARGMLKPSALKIKSTKKKAFLTMAKLSGMYKGVRWQATDEMEAKDIKRSIGANTPVIIAPNPPRSMPLTDRRQKNKASGELKMLFVGRIAPEKNVIGASYDEAYAAKCKEMIKELNGKMTVRLLGETTPTEAMNAMENADVLFLPTRGENFGHAILESMMMGTPVIISDNTPWQGLKSEGVGEAISLKDVNAFQFCIRRYRDMSATDFEQVSRNAHSKAESYCNDPEVIGLNKALFSSDG